MYWVVLIAFAVNFYVLVLIRRNWIRRDPDYMRTQRQVARWFYFPFFALIGFFMAITSLANDGWGWYVVGNLGMGALFLAAVAFPGILMRGESVSKSS
jgi:hypothetical protein